ncbi:GIN domain-containing protein [Sphingomonas sp. LT1P40]|uniref:GIN domain-containing protein n=1 Tax=Alteristakelama amylovorans TaxID=3096166 RepID=UPI002FCB2E15
MRTLIPLALLVLGAAPAPQAKNILLTGFERIRIDGPFVVRVIPGSPSAIVTGARAAIDRVSIRNQGGTLVVGADRSTWEGWREQDGVATITIASPRLRGANINGGGKLDIDSMSGQRIDLGVNGAGSLTVGTLSADQLVTTLTGTGNVKVSGGSARNARFMNYGAGSIDAGGVSVNDLTVHSQSAGDSRFTARFTAAVSTLGTGTVRIEGNATCRLAGPGPATCAGKTERR